MLQKNSLCPPRSLIPEHRPGVSGDRRLFLTAEDFDITGILIGVDACASRYWWVPALHAESPPQVGFVGGQTSAAATEPERAGVGEPRVGRLPHAAGRSDPRSPAAA